MTSPADARRRIDARVLPAAEATSADSGRSCAEDRPRHDLDAIAIADGEIVIVVDQQTRND